MEQIFLFWTPGTTWIVLPYHVMLWERFKHSSSQISCVNCILQAEKAETREVV